MVAIWRPGPLLLAQLPSLVGLELAALSGRVLMVSEFSQSVHRKFGCLTTTNLTSVAPRSLTEWRSLSGFAQASRGGHCTWRVIWRVTQEFVLCLVECWELISPEQLVQLFDCCSEHVVIATGQAHSYPSHSWMESVEATLLQVEWPHMRSRARAWSSG